MSPFAQIIERFRGDADAQLQSEWHQYATGTPRCPPFTIWLSCARLVPSKNPAATSVDREFKKKKIGFQLRDLYGVNVRCHDPALQNASYTGLGRLIQ